MNIKSSICGIQHTCINFLIFLIITKIECWPVFKQDPKCAPWSFAPKPSLYLILRATGGVLPVLLIWAIRYCWNTCNTLELRGALLHGDTAPCFMEKSCIVWTDLYIVFYHSVFFIIIIYFYFFDLFLPMPKLHSLIWSHFFVTTRLENFMYKLRHMNFYTNISKILCSLFFEIYVVVDRIKIDVLFIYLVLPGNKQMISYQDP